jgi:hypothetical protein
VLGNAYRGGGDRMSMAIVSGNIDISVVPDWCFATISERWRRGADHLVWLTPSWWHPRHDAAGAVIAYYVFRRRYAGDVVDPRAA